MQQIVHTNSESRCSIDVCSQLLTYVSGTDKLNLVERGTIRTCDPCLKKGSPIQTTTCTSSLLRARPNKINACGGRERRPSGLNRCTQNGRNRGSLMVRLLELCCAPNKSLLAALKQAKDQRPLPSYLQNALCCGLPESHGAPARYRRSSYPATQPAVPCVAWTPLVRPDCSAASSSNGAIRRPILSSRLSNARDNRDLLLPAGMI